MLRNLSIFVLILAVSTAKFPSSFKKCTVQDSVCLKEALQGAVKLLRDGFPELNAGPLNKLPIGKFEVGAGSIVKLVQKYSDGILYGLGDVEINEVRIDMGKGEAEVKFSGEYFTFNASYDIDGQILILPVKGRGPCMLRQENYVAFASAFVEQAEKNGEKVIKLKSKLLESNPKHVTYLFENLFDGNKELGDNINNVINDNWKEIFDELIKNYNIVLHHAITNYANKILAQIPLKELFLSE